jgi:hypothetical protein
MFRALLLLILFCGVACTDRTRETPEIEFDRDGDEDSEDAGAPDAAPPVEPDGICDGLADGASCALQNARGVCFRQRCRFVACETGFGDCDGEPGCETDLVTASDCGSCGNECGEGARCAPGPSGAVCSNGIVCPTDRFDLDSDSANGCEWEAVWEAPRTLVPADLAIEAAAWDGEPIVAGQSDGSRVSTRLASTPQPTVWSVPDAPQARAIDVDYSDDTLRVLWSDGFSVQEEGAMQSFVRVQCSGGGRQYVGLSGEFVATQHELTSIDTACTDEACLIPRFGLADYLRAFWPYDEPLQNSSVAAPRWSFSPTEIAECTADCLFTPEGEFAVPPECAGERQCQGEDFDDTSCGACDVDATCPDLRIVDVTATPEHVFVTTARGLIVLAAGDLAPLARIEDAFDPDDGSGGPRFVSARVGGELITLLHSTGFVRSLTLAEEGAALSVWPTAPDLGTEVDFEQASTATLDGLLVSVANDHVRLISPDVASGRTAFLTMDSAPGVQGLAPVKAVSTPDGVRVFYVAAGQLFSRLVRPISTQ